MASGFLQNAEACQECGTSEHPTSFYAVKEKSRKRLCVECLEKNPDVMLDPEPDKWMCDQHEDQIVTLFCVTCQTNACIKCVHSTHRSHELEDFEKVKDELPKAERETTSGSCSANACDFDKLAAECEEEVNLHFEKMRKEVDNKCREAREAVKEGYRQRKERIDEHLNEQIKRLKHIRDKRFAEENAEEEEEATLIEKERLKTTAEIIERHLAYKSCSRSVIKELEEESQVDNNIKHIAECHVKELKDDIVHGVLSVETYPSPYPVPLHIFSRYKGRADHFQQPTSTLLIKIICNLFVAILASLYFVVVDVHVLDFIFGCLYSDYLPLHHIAHYDYSNDTKKFIVYVLLGAWCMQVLFRICCERWVCFFELILELSKRFESEVGVVMVVGKVSSALVAMCGYIVSCKRRSDIEQRFQLQICGVSLMMPPRRILQYLLPSPNKLPNIGIPYLGK